METKTRTNKTEVSDIDPEQVYKLAQLQCTNVEIAAFFGCSEGTIRARFSEQVARGKEMGKLSLRRMQFRLAETNAAMAIWLGKQILGQREPEPLLSDEESKLINESLRIVPNLEDQELNRIKDFIH